jgi:hypothetical protein
MQTKHVVATFIGIYCDKHDTTLLLALFTCTFLSQQISISISIFGWTKITEN